MKIRPQTPGRRTAGGRRRKYEQGLATITFIILLAIMVLLAAAESRALIQLHQEVRWLEREQIKRLEASQTNSVPASLTLSKSAHNE